MSTQLTPLSADIRREAFPVLTSEQINRIRPDVRAGSVKRVASAVGEGSIAISLVHRVLGDLSTS